MSGQRGRGRGRGRGQFEGDRGRGGGHGGGHGGGDRGGFVPRGGASGGRGGRGGFGEPAQIFGAGQVPQPDPAVTKAEDASIANLASAMTAMSLHEQLPRRPGYGTQGRKIVVWTNFFHMLPVDIKKTEYYRYSVDFQGESTDNKIPKPKRKRLIQLLLATTPFTSAACSSDWAQIIVSTHKIDLGGKRRSFDIEWFPSDGQPMSPPQPGDSETTKKARKRNTFKLNVEEQATVSFAELLKHVSYEGQNGVYPSRMEAIQALNILLAHAPSTDGKIATAGSNKYYPFQGHAEAVVHNLSQGLEALRGYFTSVRTSLNRVILNVNVATGAFYQAGPLLNLMSEYGKPTDALSHQKLAAFVRKLRISTNYIRDGKVQKRKVHTISDLSGYEKHSQNTTFKLLDKNGKEQSTSVQTFFQQTHNVKLAMPLAPLVNVGTGKDPRWIPAELCTVLPGQLARRMLGPNQTRNMIEFAARQPAQNAQSIVGSGLKVTGIQPVVDGLNTHLIKFGIKVNPQMLTVHARILDAPMLRYKGNTHKPKDGKWNLADENRKPRPFHKPASLPDWNCLVINEGNRDTIFGGPTVLRQHLSGFRETLVKYGMVVGPVKDPKMVTLPPYALPSRDGALVMKRLEEGMKSFGNKPQFLFVQLPNDNAFLYDCIKYLCDVRHGIPNVCNIGPKFSKEKGQAQYWANVALKFNLKKSGINHYVAADELRPLDSRTIVFGIDVTHPSPGSSDGSPSIAGVVASVEPTFSQWPASIRTQTGRQEMVDGLEEMIIERIKLWSIANKGFPDKVIVYRDGVSEGQYNIVLAEEMPCFTKAFDKLYGGKTKHPKVSIIIAGKRHHTRFYPTTTKDADPKTGNPLPGTVVDRGITGDRLFDFYLVAHQGLQGTSKPCHYVVIKDDNKLGADQLQKLTHNLCYTFGRATRSVSLAPPAYYADILCERGRSYLHNVLKGGDVSRSYNPQTDWTGGVHQALQNTMFYL